MSRIHNPYSFESQIDNDSYNVVNDVASWEDLIYMTTDGAGVYRPSAGYITSGSFPGE